MRLLLGAGADPDRPAGDRGTTPLMHAAMGGQVAGRGLHSFPFQLNFSTSIHRITSLMNVSWSISS